MNIHIKIVWCGVILSFFVGLLMPHVSLAGNIPDVSPPECVSDCNGSDNNGNDNGDDSPRPIQL